jgi:hypothetical protein
LLMLRDGSIEFGLCPKEDTAKKKALPKKDTVRKKTLAGQNPRKWHPETDRVPLR